MICGFISILFLAVYCKTNIPNPASGCVNCKQGSFHAHASKPGKFYQCQHGKLTLMTCPGGLVFNTTSKVCDRNAAVCKEGSTKPHATDSRKYMQCVNGRYITRPCSPGLHYDPVTLTCNYPKTTTASGGSACVDGTYHPHPTDCTQYFQCVHSRKLPMTCAPGLHFNAAANACDWPANANCNP